MSDAQLAKALEGQRDYYAKCLVDLRVEFVALQREMAAVQTALTFANSDAASQLDSIADALADLCAAVGALQTQHAEQYEALRAEIERLNGLQPTFPPMPPSGSGLPRYGLRWPPAASGAPLAVEMGDGYWTPWHLAEALRAEIQGDVTLLREALEEIAEDALAALEEP